jgi:hypothetical protein
MLQIVRFVVAVVYATIKKGCVSFDYSEYNFMDPDWETWCVIPFESNWKISREGITLNGWKLCQWKYCSSFSVCPYHTEEDGFLHIGLAIKSF